MRGKRLATLGRPDGRSVSLHLSPTDQAVMVEAAPTVFSPNPGGFGRMGHTTMRLDMAGRATVRSGLLAAWRKTAPRQLVAAMAAAATPGARRHR